MAMVLAERTPAARARCGDGVRYGHPLPWQGLELADAVGWFLLINAM
ncbi:hypothetical protein ABZ532_31290 [Streptomyces sp. NPDC019396]